jgi:shikimate dehydrogenase
MHNAALAELGLAAEWSYEAIEVDPERFDGLVRGLPDEGFAGVNITVPYKLAALSLADEASAGARAIGAANTLTFEGGRIAADNTDAAGVTAAIGDAIEAGQALVLGAGGSGRAAVWALREAGARVAIWNRTQAQAEVLAAEFGVDLAPTRAGRPDIGDFDLILNATTVGLEQANTHAFVPGDLKALPLDADAIHERQVVVDLVYGSYETALASHARRRGARVIDGLEVLVHQGAASLRIWTGHDPPVETMRRAARGG